MQSSENLHKLKNITTNRLDPCNTTILLFTINMINIIMYSVCNYYLKGTTKLIYFIILAIGILVAVFNHDIKYAYKYQKMQSVILVFIMSVFPIELFIFLTTMRESDKISNKLFTAGYVLLLGGLILTVLSMLRASNRVRNGCYKEGGTGLYSYLEPGIYNTFTIVYIIIEFIIIIVPMITVSSMKDKPMVALIYIAVVLHHTIAITLPEVCLHMYCKLTYDDFKVDLTDITYCPLLKENKE